MSPQEFWLIADERAPKPEKSGPEKVGTMDRAVFDELVGVLENA